MSNLWSSKAVEVIGKAVICSKRKIKVCEKRLRFRDAVARSKGIGLTFRIPSSSRDCFNVLGKLRDTKNNESNSAMKRSSLYLGCIQNFQNTISHFKPLLYAYWCKLNVSTLMKRNRESIQILFYYICLHYTNSELI